MYYILEKMSSKDDFNFHCINIMFHANAIFRITYIICINCVWVECKTDESDIYCKKKTERRRKTADEGYDDDPSIRSKVG